MAEVANSPLARQIAGALDWWRDAGVGSALGDTPRRWLAAQESEAEQHPAAAMVAPSSAATVADPALAQADWPASLDAFAAWWLGEPWLDAGRTQGRVAPRGAAGVQLMVLVPQPEADDRDMLLSGPQGRLLANVLGAMGIGADATYLASTLPRHTPMADWSEARARGLGAVLAHHVTLVAPQRVIAFGDTIPSLLGHDPTNSAAPLTNITVGGVVIPLLTVRSLEGLLARAGWKAEVWRKWLAWTR